MDPNFDLSSIVDPLLAWYDTAKRDLPWRGAPTPYEVWISEIMLQQTRVEAVKDYYTRWIKALPTVQALNDAPLDVVRKLWEGLGYYTRMRNLKAAAKLLVEEYGGELPKDPALLARLPGIGEYTAGAICSIAFGLPTPAVDGNVLRVLARLRADDTDILSASARQSATASLSAVFPKERASDFTQAMFELGALVCLPKEPRCEGCPLRQLCLARACGKQKELPIRIVKTKRKIEELTVLVLTDGERYELTLPKQNGLLAGMYGLPSRGGKSTPDEVDKKLSDEGYSVKSITPLGECKHVFTHVTWQMVGYKVEVETLHGFAATAQEVATLYALPTAYGGYKPWIV